MSPSPSQSHHEANLHHQPPPQPDTKKQTTTQNDRDAVERACRTQRQSLIDQRQRQRTTKQTKLFVTKRRSSIVDRCRSFAEFVRSFVRSFVVTKQSQRTNKRTNDRTNERMNERTNERMIDIALTLPFWYDRTTSYFLNKDTFVTPTQRTMSRSCCRNTRKGER